MNAEPTYPVYLRDFDNYFCHAVSEHDLNVVVEENDVEEYTGWDSAGRPIALSSVDRKIMANVRSANTEIRQLRQALVDFAAKYGDADPTEIDWQDVQIGDLYSWAESRVNQYERSRRLGVRLKRFFKRS